MLFREGLAMKVIQIVPRARTRLFDALVKKEADIRSNGRGTFYRVGRATRSAAKWKHKRYQGSVSLGRAAASELVTAKLRTRAASTDEWQLLRAFLGFVERHFGDRLATVTIN